MPDTEILEIFLSCILFWGWNGMMLCPNIKKDNQRNMTKVGQINQLLYEMKEATASVYARTIT